MINLFVGEDLSADFLAGRQRIFSSEYLEETTESSTENTPDTRD